VLYRLLASRAGTSLRGGLETGKIGSRIGESITWIRHHFAEPLRIEELARQACLSPSAFHRHFKAMTSMSPLRYLQEIRLQEARRKLLAGTGDIASVGMSVGYGSPSQFSREYRRLFGVPPREDGLRLQA
jgi:transcriptional regulator GlxA family with amidase domain